MDAPISQQNLASPWMTTEEAAAYLKLAPGTMKNWRVDGDGPRHRKVGRAVRYHVDDLDRWLTGGGASATG